MKDFHTVLLSHYQERLKVAPIEARFLIRQSIAYHKNELKKYA